MHEENFVIIDGPKIIRLNCSPMILKFFVRQEEGAYPRGIIWVTVDVIRDEDDTKKGRFLHIYGNVAKMGGKIDPRYKEMIAPYTKVSFRGIYRIHGRDGQKGIAYIGEEFL